MPWLALPIYRMEAEYATGSRARRFTEHHLNRRSGQLVIMSRSIAVAWGHAILMQTAFSADATISNGCDAVTVILVDDRAVRDEDFIPPLSDERALEEFERISERTAVEYTIPLPRTAVGGPSASVLAMNASRSEIVLLSTEGLHYRPWRLGEVLPPQTPLPPDVMETDEVTLQYRNPFGRTGERHSQWPLREFTHDPETNKHRIRELKEIALPLSGQWDAEGWFFLSWLDMYATVRRELAAILTAGGMDPFKTTEKLSMMSSLGLNERLLQPARKNPHAVRTHLEVDAIIQRRFVFGIESAIADPSVATPFLFKARFFQDPSNWRMGRISVSATFLDVLHQPFLQLATVSQSCGHLSLNFLPMPRVARTHPDNQRLVTVPWSEFSWHTLAGGVPLMQGEEDVLSLSLIRARQWARRGMEEDQDRHAQFRLFDPRLTMFRTSYFAGQHYDLTWVPLLPRDQRDVQGTTELAGISCLQSYKQRRLTLLHEPRPKEGFAGADYHRLARVIYSLSDDPTEGPFHGSPIDQHEFLDKVDILGLTQPGRIQRRPDDALLRVHEYRQRHRLAQYSYQEVDAGSALYLPEYSSFTSPPIARLYSYARSLVFTILPVEPQFLLTHDDNAETAAFLRRDDAEAGIGQILRGRLLISTQAPRVFLRTDHKHEIKFHVDDKIVQ
jgi:hypothetical protein